MITSRLSAMTLLVLVGCVGSNDPALTLTADHSTFDGRTQQVVLKVQAWTGAGNPGAGVVSFTSPAGRFVDSADVALVDGFATVTFSCDPNVDGACGGSMRLGASWAGQNSGVSVVVTPSSKELPVHWKAVPTGTLATLHAAAIASDASVWAVGTGGTIVRYSNTVGHWSPMPSGVTVNLRAISVTPKGDLVIVGDGGTVLVFHAGREARFEFGHDDFTAVQASSATEVTIGSASGRIYRFDGALLTEQFSLATAVLALALDGQVLWATGEGVVAQRSSNGWVGSSAPVLARLSVAASTADGLWLGGSRMDTGAGVLLLGPTDWRATVISDPVTAAAFPPRSDERFAITERGVFRQFAQGLWTDAGAPMGGNAAVSRYAYDLVVVGAPGVSLFREP
jgi:hypothetical protein